MLYYWSFYYLISSFRHWQTIPIYLPTATATITTTPTLLLPLWFIMSNAILDTYNSRPLKTHKCRYIIYTRWLFYFCHGPGAMRVRLFVFQLLSVNAFKLWNNKYLANTLWLLKYKSAKNSPGQGVARFVIKSIITLYIYIHYTHHMQYSLYIIHSTFTTYNNNR